MFHPGGSVGAGSDFTKGNEGNEDLGLFMALCFLRYLL